MAVKAPAVWRSRLRQYGGQGSEAIQVVLNTIKKIKGLTRCSNPVNPDSLKNRVQDKRIPEN
jgi:hypothetical protein